MRFLLVGRHRDTGEARLISPETYLSREEALDALGSAMAADQGVGGADLFLVDLESSAPVVLYPQPAPAPVLDAASEPVEAIADAWEVPEIVAPPEPEHDAWLEPGVGPGAEPAPIAGAVIEAAPEPEPESEMTVAPAAEVEQGPEPEAVPVPERAAEPGPVADSAPTAAGDAYIPAASAELEAALAALNDASPVPEPDAEEPGADLAEALRRAASRMESEGISAPADVDAGPQAVEPPAAEPPSPASEEPPSMPDELSDAIFAPAPVEAESVAAWPWEGADVAPVASIAEDGPPPPPSAPDGGSYSGIDLGSAGLDDISLLTPLDADDDFTPRTVVMGDYPPETDMASPSDPIQPAVEAKVYEPGELDISAYTCDDCVYLGTCPKHHQDGPSTCGSFQWKSV